MAEGVLNRLLSDDLQTRACAISGAPALRQFFASSEEVRAVRESLKTGNLVDESVRRFTEELLADLRQGELFRHDHALAALAVVLGDWYTTFAEEYLKGLAGLRTAEMPYSTRVAREVLSRRQPPATVSWVPANGNSSGGGLRVLGRDDLAQRFPTRAENQANRVACNGV